MAETSLNKTAELQQVLAQIEASLSRAECQKLSKRQIITKNIIKPFTTTPKIYKLKAGVQISYKLNSLI